MDILNQLTPLFAPPVFENETAARAWLSACEADFEQRLTDLSADVSRVCGMADVSVLRLSGPSCSGKTTAARKLTAVLEQTGRVVYPISLDDFYIDRESLHRRAADRGGDLDYDSADTLDMDTLDTCVHDLLNRGRAELPVYDFISGTRVARRTLEVPPGVRPLFLFEGIQTLYPQVTARFTGVHFRSVFITAMRSMTVGKETFTPHRLRLMRRLVRDEATRGSPPELTLSLWRTVRANEEASIFPYAGDCDFLIDSTMGYEVHMLAPHLRRLLRMYTVQASNTETAEDIVRSLQGIEGIPSSWLPENSLYREFIPACCDD